MSDPNMAVYLVWTMVGVKVAKWGELKAEQKEELKGTSQVVL